MAAKTSLDQLKKEFNVLARQANSRIDSLKKGRYKSPAVEKLKSEGVKRFGTKAQNLKTEADYRRAIRQARSFLEAKTSTRKGLKSVTKELMRNFGIKRKPGEGLNAITRKARKLFDLYDDLKELANKGEIKSSDKYEVMEMMSQLYDQGIIDQHTSASQVAGRLDSMISERQGAIRSRQSQLNFNWEV